MIPYKDIQEFTAYEDMPRTVQDCKMCWRYKEVGLPVSPDGSYDSEWIIQGAAPGRQEVENRIPFYPGAPGGSYLEGYFKVLGIGRRDCYITNSCFCMGKDDRLPTQMESSTCARWKVYEYGRLTNPKYYLLVGNNAVRQCLGYDYPSLTQINGSIVKSSIKGKNIIFLLIFHPGYLIRNRAKIIETLEFLERFVVEIKKDWAIKWLA